MPHNAISFLCFFIARQTLIKEDDIVTTTRDKQQRLVVVIVVVFECQGDHYVHTLEEVQYPVYMLLP